MTVAVDVVRLEPADLAAPVPPWELMVAPGEVAVAVIAGTADAWNAVAANVDAARELSGAAVITIASVGDGALTEAGCALAGRCDLLAGGHGVDELVALARAGGAPALVAAQLLRMEALPVLGESFAYSMLLAGEDFRAWRAGSRPAPAHDAAPRIAVEQRDGTWLVTLTRPARHNAFDGRMREELCDALDAVASGPRGPVVLVGSGSSFCSGGDLDEFGAAADPVAAHVVRTGRSVARRLQRLRSRLVVGVHGHCVGAGVEFAAFATHVVAAHDAVFALPELSMGLNLGAGGASSIPARIGRQRTLELLLRNAPMDANRALDWGLVDELAESEELLARCLEAARSLR